jgi:DNA polymerase III alpha subunit
MADREKIKKEIFSCVKDESFLPKVTQEVKEMENTEGIDAKNNLEVFYNIWKSSQGRVGDKNVINSWTAYAIGLTSQKPSQDDFLPSRRAFARAGFPDIDTDFADVDRNKIYEYLIDKYGRENVGNIGTHGVLKFKSCVTRIIKSLDIADAWDKGKEEYTTENVKAVYEILEPFPKSGLLKVKDENGKSHLIKTTQDAYDHSPEFRYYMDKYPDIMKYALGIEGIFANYGFHAGGVCLSNTPLQNLAPLRRATKGETLATQFVSEELESIGLIKFDVLAISTLTVIMETLKLIKQNYDIDLDIFEIPMDDEKTFALYRSGNLGGVFQCESYPMQKTMKDIGVDSFNDIMAAISLFRPGPMENIPEYCSRKKGYTSVNYFHTSIEKHVKPFLKDTYGIIIYQETVMQICNVLAGFSIAEGYVMIKAIGKKKVELMDKFKSQFISGCVKNDVPEDVATEYWDKFIVPFSSYGFNKCLDGKMLLKDKNSGKYWTIEDLAKEFEHNKKLDIILDSYKDGKIIEDELIDVFSTGEKDVYEIELDNGFILKCTLDHKFICSDEKEHTVREIMDSDLDIICLRENMQKCKIKSIKKLDKRTTYNLTMKSKQHNYVVFDEKKDIGIVSLNSHAASYGVNSYYTAYLKSNYPEEFICSLLSVTLQTRSGKKYDKVDDFEREFKNKMNIKFLPRDINECSALYTISKKKDISIGVKQSEIRPALVCKGMGYNCALEIESKQPFRDLRDFAKRINSSIVDTRVIDALYTNGYFKHLPLTEGEKVKKKTTKDSFVKYYSMIIDDQKKSNSRGVDSQDIFA